MVEVGSWYSASVIGSPPSSETFFSFSSPAAQKATHFPSGEKNGVVAPSVPGITSASAWSIAR